MKRRNYTLLALTILGGLFAVRSSAQTVVNMPYNTGVFSTFQIANPAACEFINFFDNGGSAANYSNSSNPTLSVVTFAPTIAGNKVRATFTSYASETTFDALYVYDGTLASVANINNTAITTVIPGQFASASAIGATFRAGGWQGAGIPGPFQATAGNATGALTFQFDSDASVNSAGWAGTVVEVAAAACALTPAANQTISTGAANCTGNATTALPSFSPGGCQTAFTLRYVVNGGAPITIPAPLPATVSIPNLPRGVNTITWQLVDACFGATASSANQTITVNDLTPPAITCPQSVTINLAPGDCNQIVSFNVTAVDNCTTGPVAQVSTVNAANNGGNVGGMTFFDITNLTGTPQTIKELGVKISTATNVNIYTKSGTYAGFQNNAAAWTLSGTANATAGPFAGPVIGGNIITPAPVNGTGLVIPPGVTGFALETPTAAQSYTNGTGANQSFTDGTIRIDLGSAANTPFGAAFTPRVFNGYVKYQTILNTTLVQTSGLASGSTFPIGVTTNCFKATDAAGNTSTCCFNVTVLEYPNPIQSLVCNDLVQVSLDPNCTATLNADQILEGGPYGCYDNYIVELDKVAPFGNGPWVPAVLGAGDIGKTYQVRVTDPKTGNKCWGNIKVEDKLKPVLVCTNDPLLCNQDPAPGLYPTGSGTITVPATGLPISTLENQVKSVTIPVNLPSNAVITDVDFRTRVSGTPFDFDLYIEVKSPTGTVVTPWVGVGGCGAVPLATRFDDDSPLDLSCPGYTSDKKNQIPFNQGLLSDFDGGTAGGNWTITFGDAAHSNPGNDNPASAYTLEIAELIISYISYGASLPNQLVLNQTAFQTGPNTYSVPAGAGNPVLESCSDATLTYLDTEVPQNCASGLTKIINRKWTATDASGNTSTCLQVLSFKRPTIDDVVFPPNYDDIDEPAFTCSANQPYPTPEWIEGSGGQGFPHVFGEPDGCSISWTYEDAVIDICDGTYKVRRKWVAIDWCSGIDVEHNQIIKVLDKTGPAMTCPANITVGTDPFTCCATTDLPDVIIADNCSRIANISAMIQVFDPQTNQQIAMHQVGGSLQNFPGNNLWAPDTLGNFGTTPCLPLGSHIVTYIAEDDCGNTSSCTFRLIVRDYTPPVAACDEYTVVGIGVDDPFDCYGPAGNQGIPSALDACSFAGVTWVKATTFDDGSYDNCGDIHLTVRRMAPYSDCINGLNFLNGHPACDDPFPDFPSEFERAVSEYDSIKFYCCEVGTTQTVILRAYQLDPQGNITVGPDGSPVYNECMVQVEVQDKIKPVCQSPANVTVSCENFDPSLWVYGKPSVIDNCCLDTAQVYQGQCGLSHSVSYSLFDTVCNKGTITRTFRAFDCHGLSSQCTQRIVVNYKQDYWLKFPNDVIVTTCDGAGNYGEPTFSGKDCELLGVSHEDQVYTVVPDACFKIERTWTVINWCTYNPNLGCIEVPNPNPNAIVNHPSNLTGPTVSPAGTPAPWNPTVLALTPGATPTNFSFYWDANANCYKYKQIIKIIDTQAPTLSCPASPVTICDLTPNDPLFWNQSYWWDASISSHDLCETPTDLNITGTDLCSGSNIDIRYLLFLDLDGDGTMETVISSTNLPGFNNVNYNNAGNSNFSGGTPRAFDNRPVPSNQKYGFALQTTVNGTSKTGAVRWNTLQSPSTYTVPELPYGTHKIKWIVSDGCGNEKVCEYTFVVKDCKAPTVVCINGLSVNIMPTKMVVLWDTDFLQYTEDNCTPSNQLVTAIRRSGTGTGFPLNPDGTPQKSVQFTCDDIGTQLVELWSIDKAGNADYCETYVIIQDNGGFCSNSAGSVAGVLKTESNKGLEDANVDVNGSANGLPPVSMFTTSNNQGAYNLNGIPFLGNYTVTPGKDNDPLNGVSTFDLVLINKHILGLEPLNSPYKMIAADANNSRSLTTFDIVELRKLILGIYTELPNNTSWRFVDKSFAFPNAANPFQTIFPETKQIASMTGDQMNENFVSVKVGDVNDNAVPSSLVSSDDRTAGTLMFDVEDRDVKAGETFTVNFKAAEKVQGYQFTMNYPNLEVVDVVPGANMTLNNFGVFAADHALTTSWDGEMQGEFGVTFRAKTDGSLSKMLGVSSRITRAEAYNAASDRLQVAFRFNGTNGTTISGLGFELYQNTPNPFVSKTQIGFYLPQASEATLTIYDESGRTIYTQKGDFTNGYNAVTIDRSVLNTTGVLYYKLETATDSATKKMIQTK